MGSSFKLSPAQGAPALPTPGVQNLKPSRLIHFDVETATPPTDLYLFADDTLQLVVLAPTAGLQVTLNTRLLRPNGEVSTTLETMVTTANRGVVQKIITPG